MERITALFLSILIGAGSIGATPIQAQEINNNNIKKISTQDAIVKQITTKDQLENVVGFAQIKDKVYYVDKIDQSHLVGSQKPQFMLKTIDNKGSIKSIGEIFDLINWHEDDHALSYVDLVRVNDLLILVTNCRLFYLDFNTNKFEYLDRQSDVDFFEEALTWDELQAKKHKITVPMDMSGRYELEFDPKDRGGYIKNAYVSENMLYLQIYPVIYLSASNGQVPPGLEDLELNLNDNIVVVNPYGPHDRYIMGMQKFETDWLTVDEDDDLMVRESIGKIRAFSQFYYYTKYFYQNAYGPEDTDINTTSYNMEEEISMTYKNVSYHTPLFYNNKLLAQSAVGLVYLDKDKLNSKDNTPIFWLTETNDIYFGYNEFDNRSTRILEWCVGQDGNIYALVNTLAKKQSLNYQRLIKIIPPSYFYE